MSERKPAPLTDWQLAVLEEVMANVAKPLRPIVDWMISAGLMEPPVPTAPRERALYLRKHRNTGPGKPIQEQRRRR